MLDLILHFNYFSFSNCNTKPNPTCLTNHQILSPNPVAKLTGGRGAASPLAGHFEVFGPPVTTLLILLSDIGIAARQCVVLMIFGT